MKEPKIRFKGFSGEWEKVAHPTNPVGRMYGC